MKLRTIIFCMISLVFGTIQAEEVLPQLDNPMSEIYLKKHIRKDLPRLGYTAKSVKKVRKSVKNDPLMQNMYAAIKLNAAKVMKEAPLERIIIGRRMLGVSRELLYRINVLGFVYLMEEDEAVLERINAELQSVCNFVNWNPRHFLDVGEMSMGVALAVDWTQGNLPDSTIQLAKHALKTKAIDCTWRKNGKKWGIAYGTTNWNQVCSGGLIAAAITIADEEPELASRTISRALDGLPNVLACYGPDGVYPEGSTYWAYATRYSVATITMFESAFGTDFGHYDIPGFKESALFRMMCNTSTGQYYNYSDCELNRFRNGDQVLAWFAMKSGVGEYFESDLFMISPEEMGRLPRFSGLSMGWLSQFEATSTIDLPMAWKGEGHNPIAVFRTPESDKHHLYLGCKGGCPSLSHGNMDAGSFIFEMDGVRWSWDLPREDYHPIEATGFNLWGSGQDAERWQLLSKNNYGHSTITVNDELFVHDAKSEIIDFSNDDTPSVTFDLSPMYGDNVEKVQRTFVRKDLTTVLIEDAIECSSSTQSITWQMMTKADIVIKGNHAILTQEGQQLYVDITSHPNLSFSVVSLDPTPLALDGKIKGLKRLEIRIPSWYIEASEMNLQVRLAHTEY